MKLQKTVRIMLLFLTVSLTCIFLWWHYQIGLTRYFDADELAYLHWAHNVSMGKLPYIDFLLYVPPWFLYVVAPLFSISSGVAILTTGRVLAFVIFVGMCAALSAVFVSLRGDKEKVWKFFLPALILSFLPLPFDKFIELRPDNLAMLVALIATVFHCHALSQNGKRSSWVMAGLLYSSSLLILPKAVPQVVVAIGVTLAWVLWADVESRQQRSSKLYLFGIGCMAPIVVFGLWIGFAVHSFSQLDAIFYSLVTLPFEVNKLGKLFFMQPDLFFYPNQMYYGTSGVSSGLIVNHILWLVGLGMGVVRLMTPFIPRGKNGVWAELLIAGSFVLYIASFVLWYPMRHAQYLIPVAVFIAYYVADAIVSVWENVRNDKGGLIFFVIVYAIGLGYLYEVNLTVNRVKLSFTNIENVRALQTALSTIPKGAYVLDLDGSTIYFRDPYYVSSVPFGQWEPYLTRPLPSLSQALEKTHTNYIYESQLERVKTLPIEDQAYIKRTFIRLPNSHILVRMGL